MLIHRTGQNNQPQTLGDFIQNALTYGKTQRFRQIIVQRLIQLTEAEHIGKNLRMLKFVMHSDSLYEVHWAETLTTLYTNNE